MEWEPPPDSPAAILDETEHLKRVAADLHKWQPPKRTLALTEADLDRALSKLCETIGKAVRQMVVEPLQKRIAELEQGQLKMGGTWKAGERYAENTLVSFQGGLWLCRADTEARPGSGSPAWRLCVKKGDAA